MRSYCRTDSTDDTDMIVCGSMGIGGITPEYVYRMLGGVYSIDEIRPVLRACLKEYHDGKGIC